MVFRNGDFARAFVAAMEAERNDKGPIRELDEDYELTQSVREMLKREGL